MFRRFWFTKLRGINPILQGYASLLLPVNLSCDKCDICSITTTAVTRAVGVVWAYMSVINRESYRADVP